MRTPSVTWHWLHTVLPHMDFPQRSTEISEHIQFSISKVKYIKSEDSWYLCLSAFPSIKWCLENTSIMQFENMLIKWIMHNHYLCCLAKHIEPRRADTKSPVGQGQAGQGPWTEMSCGRCFAAFLRISCHRCNIPERSLFLEELNMEGGSGGARVLLCVWENPLQVGVLGCMRVGWKVLFLHWWAERSWLIAGYLSSF